jgi:predicted permease
LLGANAEVALLGAAIAISTFGIAAAAPLALILAVDGAMLATITPLMMALGRTGESEPAVLAGEIARRVVLNPLLIATVAAFAAAAVGLRVSSPLDGLLTVLRQAAIPLGLLLFGATLPWPVKAVRDPEVPALILVKLVGHPVILYLLLGWVGGFDRAWVGTAVLLAALPPTVGVLAAAKVYGIESERIAATILFASLAAVGTLAVSLALAGAGAASLAFR